jgi:hypothetical protein
LTTASYDWIHDQRKRCFRRIRIEERNDAASRIQYRTWAFSWVCGAGGDCVSALAVLMCTTAQLADYISRQRLKYSLPTYRYLSAGNFSNITPRYWLGAMHSCESQAKVHEGIFTDIGTADLPLVFGTHYQFRGNSTELEWETSYAMEDSWVSFAADSTSDPTYAEGMKWPKYSTEGDTTLVFGGNNTAARLLPGSYADSFIVCTGSQ